MSVLGVALAEPGWVLNPRTGAEYAAGTNPYAIEGSLTGVLFGIGFALTTASLVAAFVGAAVRFRRSIGVERQQMKWFILSTGVLVLVLSSAGVLWHVTPVVWLLAAVCLTVWPVTIGIAVLRYRLYDVDLVISRTFTYLLLTVVLAVVYAGTVVVLGAVVGRDEAWVTAGARLLAAASFKLLHRRVQERVDRRFRPERHRALSMIAAFTSGCATTTPSRRASLTRCGMPWATRSWSSGSCSSPTNRRSTHTAARQPVWMRLAASGTPCCVVGRSSESGLVAERGEAGTAR